MGIPALLLGKPNQNDELDEDYEDPSIPVDLLYQIHDHNRYCEVGASAVLMMVLHKEILDIDKDLRPSIERGLKEGYLKIKNNQVVSIDYKT